ncbi:hypothetical protein GE09DRAFT_421104 [Coniochaeta sp. 2T2.1]|nr:hypothetical protein GE09DRAFT_421104 [Coniochaeta sp. 2T2.1]
MPLRKQALAPVAPPKQEVNIPLHCLLCPKKPTFSDVSHLLTHISSKSHLSNRFKAEIRSGKERDARETLRQFDHWYDRYNIQELLADRMDAKDKKKGPSKRGRDESPEHKPRTYNKREKGIKPEPEPTLRRSTRGSLHAHSSRQDYGDDDSPYRTPVTRRSQRLLSGNAASRRKLKSEQSDDVEFPEESIQDEEPIEEPVEAPPLEMSSDKSKLKGVFWPGMNLFDSATEEQRRKRNQRKDAGVLRNMEQVAANVQPTEYIWSGDITDLHRKRYIYATPSEVGTPEPEGEEDAEPKKKRARRSTNAPKTAPARKKRASTRAIKSKKEIKQEEDDESVPMSEAIDASLETTPVDETESESKRVPSSAPASQDGDEEVYDVFRDTPVPGSGQFDNMLQQYYYNPYGIHPYDLVDPQLGSPALTLASGLSDGSMNSMNFDPSARQALQPLNPNLTMEPSAPNGFKHALPQLRRSHSEMSPPSNAFYAQPHGISQGNFNNPLSFAQGRHQNHMYANQFGGTFAEDSKALVGFQPINPGMMHGTNFSPYPLNPSSASYYTQAAPQEEAQRDWKV